MHTGDETPTFTQIAQSSETRQNPTDPDTISAIALPNHPLAPSRTPHPAIPKPQSPPRLSLRQHQAISLLLDGHTDAEVAQQTGVTRPTVCDWRNHHPLFIFELDRQRQLRQSQTVDRYNRLVENALAVIEGLYTDHYVDDVDRARIALGVVRSATRHTLRPTPAPSHPDDILNSLLAQGLPIAPDDSPANDAPPPPPPPPPTPKKPRPPKSPN